MSEVKTKPPPSENRLWVVMFDWSVIIDPEEEHGDCEMKHLQVREMCKAHALAFWFQYKSLGSGSETTTVTRDEKKEKGQFHGCMTLLDKMRTKQLVTLLEDEFPGIQFYPATDEDKKQIRRYKKVRSATTIGGIWTHLAAIKVLEAKETIPNRKEWKAWQTQLFDSLIPSRFPSQVEKVRDSTYSIDVAFFPHGLSEEEQAQKINLTRYISLYHQKNITVLCQPTRRGLVYAAAAQKSTSYIIDLLPLGEPEESFWWGVEQIRAGELYLDKNKKITFPVAPRVWILTPYCPPPRYLHNTRWTAWELHPSTTKRENGPTLFVSPKYSLEKWLLPRRVPFSTRTKRRGSTDSTASSRSNSSFHDERKSIYLANNDDEEKSIKCGRRSSPLVADAETKATALVSYTTSSTTTEDDPE